MRTLRSEIKSACLMLASIAVLAAPSTSLAQLDTAAAPTPPSALELPAGLTLAVPQGWRGAVADAATASLAGPDGDSTILVVMKTETREQIEAELAAPLDLGRGIVLTPSAAPQKADDDYLADYAVAGTPRPARGVLRIKVLADGRAIALVGVVPEAAVEDTRRIEGEIMAASLAHAPVALQAAEAGSWGEYLRGRYLAMFYSGGTYHEKHELWFCSDGTYASAMDGGGFTADVASGAFGSNATGTWSATGDLSAEGSITMIRSDGQQGQARVQMGADGLYLNGARWLRGDNNRCR